jgi:rhamnogalacturonan endolyase
MEREVSMERQKLLLATLLLFVSGAFPIQARAQYHLEYLSRGVVAVRSSETQVYVGWRLLGTDLPGTAFNIYRSTGAGKPQRLNAAPLKATTDLIDAPGDFSQPNTYLVKPVIAGIELPWSARYKLPADSPVRQYLRFPFSSRRAARLPRAKVIRTPPTMSASAISMATAISNTS